MLLQRARPDVCSFASLSLGLVMGALLTLPAGGQEAPQQRGVAEARPNSGAGPTEVEVGIMIADLMRIMDVEQAFRVDFVVEATWHDPRLALDEVGGGARRLALHEVWHPQLQVVNLHSIAPQFDPSVLVDSAGRCLYLQRYVGTLTFDLDLHEFPFDSQTLHIQVVTALLTENDVRLTASDSTMGRSDQLTIVDWEVGDVVHEIVPFQLRDGGLRMASLRVALPVERYANYFIFKVITPLVIIVAMSWLVFWIDPTHGAPQIAIGTTALLTLIAYRFLLGNLVPRVSYLTRLDVFIFVSTVVVFIALAEAVLTVGLVSKGKTDVAARLDRWCRVLAPLGLLATLWYSFG